MNKGKTWSQFLTWLLWWAGEVMRTAIEGVDPMEVFVKDKLRDEEPMVEGLEGAPLQRVLIFCNERNFIEYFTRQNLI